MSVVAMNSCTRDSPTAMIDDRNDPDAPRRGAQNALQAIRDPSVGLYPHLKVFMPIAMRLRARQAPGVNRTTTKQHRANDDYLQIRSAEKRPKTMLVTNPQNR
jgi:hypothetical protein